MKPFLYKLALVTSVFCLPACNDLTEINTNPDQLGAEKINSKYILTSALSFTANQYIRDYTYGYTSDHGIAEAMQYMQRDYIGYEINSFVWRPLNFATTKPLIDFQTLLDNSASEPDEQLKRYYMGVASIMRAFWFGFHTSAWGDVPYSQALQGRDQVFKPVYDTQKNVFKGIIQELKVANELLNGLGTISVVGNADLVYAGNTLKWRKLANSLRVRYYLRLSDKKDELLQEQLDIVAELKEILANPTKFPIFESNADNAMISLPGTDAFNSWVGGPLANSNRSQFYRRKPCASIIDYLKETNDPRLTVWFRPVDVQLKIGTNKDEYVKNPLGQIVRNVEKYQSGLDTSRYVGLKPALGDPTIYNLGATANYSKIGALNNSFYLDQGANPHVSYLADMYAQNTSRLVKVQLMSQSELSFLLAEASLKGWISDNATQHFRNGIASSLDQYEIANGSETVYNITNHDIVAFDRAAFLSEWEQTFASNPSQQLEWLMYQKWLALWMTPEFWFDWRRTGLPALGNNVIEGSNGDKIPVRLIYGSREYVVNEENVRSAVTKLEPAEDSQWSKMWLIQGTSKPW